MQLKVNEVWLFTCCDVDAANNYLKGLAVVNPYFLSINLDDSAKRKTLASSHVELSRSKFVPFRVWHGDCHYLPPTQKQSLSLSKRFRFVTSWTWTWQIRGSEVVSYLCDALTVPTMVLNRKSMAESLFVWTHCQAWLISTTMCLTSVMPLCQGEFSLSI